MKSTLIVLLALVMICGSFIPTAGAADVGLAWDANKESSLAGYKIYWGTDSGSLDNVVDVGNVTEYTVVDLTDGQIYYFAATAYDTAGNESGYSDILQYIPRTGKLIIIIDAPQGFNKK